MPYTAAAEETRGHDPVSGAELVKVKRRDAAFLPLEEEDDEDLLDTEGGGLKRTASR